MAYDSNLPAPTFDLDAYASNYEGALLPLRLAHISTHCPPLSHQSLTLALIAAKQGKDVQLYTRILDIADRLGFPDLSTPDEAWLAQREEGNKRELARLEGELRGYKNNLIRESIRMGQEDLAMHLLLTGGPLPSVDASTPQATGYAAAYSSFAKMRDYCTTPTHIASMTLRQIYTAVLSAIYAQQTGSSAGGHWNSVLTNASRIRTVGVKEEEMVKLTPIMYAMTGLAHLGQGAYRDAAQAFLNTPIDYATNGSVHGSNFPRLIASGNDIAIYGGLTALATMTRDELTDHVLGGPFRTFLELEPHMRKAISLYTTAKYQPCLALLKHYYADWSLDVFLGGGSSGHVDRLLARIREKSITAYFSSFAQVSLTSLAETFPPTTTSTSASAEEAMEAELLHLISSGTLSARLDVVNGLLIAPEKDARTSTHAEAAAAAAEVERTLLLRLHRVNVTLAGLEVPRPKGMAGVGNGVGGY